MALSMLLLALSLHLLVLSLPLLALHGLNHTFIDIFRASASTTRITASTTISLALSLPFQAISRQVWPTSIISRPLLHTLTVSTTLAARIGFSRPHLEFSQPLLTFSRPLLAPSWPQLQSNGLGCQSQGIYKHSHGSYNYFHGLYKYNLLSSKSTLRANCTTRYLFCACTRIL